MSVIKFVSLVENKVTVTIERAGLPTETVTRPIPVAASFSQEAFDAYMRDYVAGLAAEFPDLLVPSAAISGVPGAILNSQPANIPIGL